MQIQVLGVDYFLKMGLQMFQTKVMQCEVCQEFVYTFGASALQLPEELSQNSHYSTTVTNMVNAGAYPGSPKSFDLRVYVCLDVCLYVCMYVCYRPFIRPLLHLPCHREVAPARVTRLGDIVWAGLGEEHQ